MAHEPLITATGRLGADPELKFLKDGRSFAVFSLAVTPSSKVNEVWVDKETMWFRVALWTDADEFIETSNKGNLVTVTGRFTIGSYEAKTGETRTSYNIDADSAVIIPTKQKNQVEDPWL